MSIEDIQGDLAANIAEAKGLTALSTMGDVTNHIKNTFWPFVENLVGELVEMDGALEDMYHQQEDVLRFETGKQLMATIVGAKALIGDLKARCAGLPDVLKAISEWEKTAQESAELLEEITLPEGASAEEDDDEEDEDDEDDADADDGDETDDKKGATPQ